MTEKIKQYGVETFSSLRVRNFRIYFVAQAISQAGTWMQVIGQSWLVLRLTNSGTALGLIIALQFLPVTFLGPWGGVVADRFSKRRILFATQTISGILALILAITVATNTVQLWMIYVLAVSLGLVTAIDNPTRQTFVLEMVGKKYISNAVTLNAMEMNLARVIGPAVAGIIIAGAGLAPCFYINAGSFAAVLICLVLIDKTALEPSKQTGKMKGQLAAGFKYVWHTPILRNVLLMLVIIGMLSYEFQVSLPLLARYTFHGNAGSYALFTSAMGIGSVVGGLLTARRTKTAPRALIVSVALLGVTMLAAAIAPTLWIEIICLLAVGISSISFISLSNSMLQIESSSEMRGRVMALWAVGFIGTTPIGGPVIGFIAEHANPRWGIATGGFAALLVSIIGFVAIRRHPAHVSNLQTEAAS